MDGFEATKKIRSIEKEKNDGKRIKIIALTANAKEEDRKSCIDVGMDDFTTKPLRREEITNMIKNHLN
jgi:CheY-like chemotaxis protein